MILIIHIHLPRAKALPCRSARLPAAELETVRATDESFMPLVSLL